MTEYEYTDSLEAEDGTVVREMTQEDIVEMNQDPIYKAWLDCHTDGYRDFYDESSYKPGLRSEAWAEE